MLQSASYSAPQNRQTRYFRDATRDDIPLLRFWDKQPHVKASDPDSDWEWETELLRTPDWREQLIYEEDGRPIGFVQIIDPAREDSHYWGAVAPNQRAIDIWIGLEIDLNRGYGSEMMHLALARCFSDPRVTAVLIDPLVSNDRAHRFYKRFGFTPLERRMFDTDDCLVFKLTREQYSLPETAGEPA